MSSPVTIPTREEIVIAGAMKRKPHWYYITYSECPVCGRTSIYRERRYGPRPKRFEQRNRFEVDTLCASSDVAGV